LAAGKGGGALGSGICRRNLHRVQRGDAAAVRVILTPDPVLLWPLCPTALLTLRRRRITVAHVRLGLFRVVVMTERSHARHSWQARRIVQGEGALLGVGQIDVGQAQHKVELLSRRQVMLAAQQHKPVALEGIRDQRRRLWVCGTDAMQLHAEMRLERGHTRGEAARAGGAAAPQEQQPLSAAAAAIAPLHMLP
jgi:hypothetical protein